MSDEEESNPDEQEQEEQQKSREEEEQQDQDENEQDENQESDDQDEQDEQQEQSDEQDEPNDDQSHERSQPNEELPKFRQLETQQFKFASLLSEISNLSLNVDHFINTLPSHGGSSYYRSSYAPIQYHTPTIPQIVHEEPKVIIMKDEDVQVSMQPQIIIQATKKEKSSADEQYRMSNESNKFLAHLYEQNKKLKRWQNSSVNTKLMNKGSSVGNGFYGSRERFQRQQFQRGLFNVQQRNKEIDEAMQLLKRSEQ